MMDGKMKYYELSKRSLFGRMFIKAIGIFLVAVCPPMLWIMTVNFFGGIGKGSPIPIILLVAYYAAAIALAVYDFASLKGVFLYDDCMEICNGLFPRRKIINYSDIMQVLPSKSFHTDPDRIRLSYYSNFIAGDPFSPCVKVRLKNGKWRFVGVDDAYGLVNELSRRMCG